MEDSDNDYINNNELVELLIDIAKSYGSVNAMINKSLEMKQNEQPDKNVYILDTAIALQLYIQNKDKPELKDMSIEILNKCMNTLDECII